MATQLYEVIPGRPFGRGTTTVTQNSNPNSFTNCWINAGSGTLTTTDNFGSNDALILIHQSYGVSSLTEDNWHVGRIVSGGGSTSMTISPAPTRNFVDGAQCTIIPEVMNMTIGSGWGGKSYGATRTDSLRYARGGIIAFAVSNRLTINAVMHQNGYQGYISSSDRGGMNEWQHFNWWWNNAPSGGHIGGAMSLDDSGAAVGGNSSVGYNGSEQISNILNGGGGGGGAAYGHKCGGGGGGSYGGATASDGSGSGVGGSGSGNDTMTAMHFGGGGGGNRVAGGNQWTGGSGGGIIVIWAKEIVMGGSGGIQAIGGVSYGNNSHAGGSGAGGSILINTERATLGTNQIDTNSGQNYDHGGRGGVGRVRINYGVSYTGTIANAYATAGSNTNLIDSSGAMFFSYY